jgi:hypothetical protein
MSSGSQAEASSGYQGWRTYETWAVALWIDNEVTSFRYWREAARHCQREAPNTEQVKRGIWTPKEAARFNLADQLKEEITEGHPLNEPSMYADLLSAAFSEVDWREIAESILDELA